MARDNYSRIIRIATIAVVAPIVLISDWTSSAVVTIRSPETKLGNMIRAIDQSDNKDPAGALPSLVSLPDVIVLAG
jgi:hypothetical protein